MSSNSTPVREAGELELPETLNIASMLAELMPSGAPPAHVPTVPLQPPAEDATDDAIVPPLEKNELSEEVLNASGSSPLIQMPPPMPTVRTASGAPMTPPPLPSLRPPSKPSIRITANVVRQPAAPAPPTPVAFAETEAPPKPASVAELLIPPPLPAPPVPPPQALGEAAAEPMSEFLRRYNWKNEEPPAPTPPPLPEPRMEDSGILPITPAGAVNEFLPLGELPARAFFALMNWANDPAAVRHPKRPEPEIDEETRMLSKSNPYYTPARRQPDSRSVANVLAEIAWR